jgi:hypothetical protein
VPDESLATLKQSRSQAVSLEAEVHDLHERSQQVAAEIAAHQNEREQLGTLVAAYRDELERRRLALDERTRADFDLRRELFAAQQQLDRLKRERSAMAGQRPQVVKVQSLPTPLGKTVVGKEIHFQLREHRLAFIPLEKLLEEFTSTAKSKLWKLDDQAQMSDTIGPVGGFRMRYKIGRFEIPAEVARETGRGGSVIRLVKWELLPVSSQLGETADEALGHGSEFRRTLASLRPGTSITIWTYPESFEDFRRIKAELHSLGFPTAARPLPADQPIAGSPDGTKSSAQ